MSIFPLNKQSKAVLYCPGLLSSRPYPVFSAGEPQTWPLPRAFQAPTAHSLRGEPTASCLLSCDSSGPQEGSPARAPTAQHLGLSEPAPERSSSPSAPSLLGVIPGVSSGLLPHTALLAVPVMSSCTPPCAMSYQGNGGIWRMHVQEGESQAVKPEGAGAPHPRDLVQRACSGPTPRVPDPLGHLGLP